MQPMVEICLSRLTPDVMEVKEELEQDPEIEVMESPCLGNCELCAQTPYVMVNGEIVTGENKQDLLANIRSEIEKQKKQMEDLFDLL